MKCTTSRTTSRSASVRSGSVVRMRAIVMRRSAPIHSLRYGSPIAPPHRFRAAGSPDYFGEIRCADRRILGVVLGSARLSVLIGLLVSLAPSTPLQSAEPVCPPSATVPTPEALQEAARNAQ